MPRIALVGLLLWGLAAAEYCADVTCGQPVTIPAPCECTADNMAYTFSKCNPATNTKSLLYFWRPPATCLATTVTLPPPVPAIPCDILCAPGEFLDISQPPVQCSPCLPGHYSQGTGINWVNWNSWPSQMSTTCVSALNQPCQPWRLQGRSIDSGVNLGLNRISSYLTLSLQFITNGTVSFSYRVSSEQGWDGLIFRVDGAQQFFASGTTNFTTWVRRVGPGYHTFVWEYLKDVSFERGEDRVVIRSISVTGSSPPLLACSPCQPGRFQPASHSTTCDPCPANFISTEFAASACSPCPSGQVSYPGSTSCYIPRSCSAVDYSFSLSPCVNGQQNKTYSWITPAACDPSTGVLPPTETIACTLSCPAGQYLVAGQPASCAYCPSGTYTETAGVAAECTQCGLRTQGNPRVSTYTTWGATLPPSFTTSCFGQCSSPGWRSAGAFIDSGAFHPPGAATILQLTADIESPATAQFVFALTCAPNVSSLAFSLDNSPPSNYICQGCAAQTQTASVQLGTGRHVLRWMFRKNPWTSNTGLECDSAQIFSITVAGVGKGLGGSTGCVNCPAGTYASAPGECTGCASGTRGDGTGTNCTACPAETYSLPASAACLQCGAGTSSQPASAACQFNCSRIIPAQLKSPAVFNLSWIPPRADPMNGTLVINACGAGAIPGVVGDAMIRVETSSSASLVSGSLVSFFSLPLPSQQGFVALYNRTAGPCVASISFFCDVTQDPSSLGRVVRADPAFGCPDSFAWHSRRACRLCTESDYKLDEGICQSGRRFSVYHWITDFCYGGVALPEPVSEDCTIEDPNAWRKYAFIGIGTAVGVVAIAAAIIMGLVLWNRRIYRQYKRLAVSDDEH